MRTSHFFFFANVKNIANNDLVFLFRTGYQMQAHIRLIWKKIIMDYMRMLTQFIETTKLVYRIIGVNLFLTKSRILTCSENNLSQAN